MTYAFTGCSGAISSTATARLQWGPLPDLGGTSLTAHRSVHGPLADSCREGGPGEQVPWEQFTIRPLTTVITPRSVTTDLADRAHACRAIGVNRPCPIGLVFLSYATQRI